MLLEGGNAANQLRQTVDRFIKLPGTCDGLCQLFFLRLQSGKLTLRLFNLRNARIELAQTVGKLFLAVVKLRTSICELSGRVGEQRFVVGDFLVSIIDLLLGVVELGFGIVELFFCFGEFIVRLLLLVIDFGKLFFFPVGASNLA